MCPVQTRKYCGKATLTCVVALVQTTGTLVLPTASIFETGNCVENSSGPRAPAFTCLWHGFCGSTRLADRSMHPHESARAWNWAGSKGQVSPVARTHLPVISSTFPSKAFGVCAYGLGRERVETVQTYFVSGTAAEERLSTRSY